ncbi:DUF945 family protein [Thiocapsa roseopersicina]|uniref:Uncharacterized conserved protein YdgA, DUF945 family n=1 Tax=Thiocapsa roseopersicina TaxID=1058 RepID=A0A1H2SPG5_THIRO|nr:DUF945 family protein [Thiocapsa roseopersicina]SDW32949.1 Uncharacterized conserved protein YdgA, DUF945 family [Thiocapsa roseopersicina]
MRRLLGGVALTIAIVLGLLLAVGPLALGYLAKAGYEDLLTDLVEDLPDREILENSYQRGWFASSAAFEVLIPPDPAEQAPLRPTRIRLDSRIEQGPLLWLTTRFPPVIGRVHARLAVEGLPVVLPVLPISIDLHGDGSGRMQLRVPPGETLPTAQAMGLQHGPLDGDLVVSAGQEAVEVRLMLSEGVLTTPTGPLARLSDLRFEADRPDDSAGTGRLRVSSVELMGATDGVGSGAPVQSQLRLEGLSATLSRTLREGLLDLRLGLAAQQLATASMTYGRSELGLSGERLDVEALADLGEGIRLLATDQVGQEMRGLFTAGLIAGLAPRFIASATRIGVEPIRIETPDGLVLGRLDLRLDPGTDSPSRLTSGVVDWLILLRADGDLELPEAVALDWMTRWLEPGIEDGALPTSESAAEQAARQEAETLLAGWIRDGWVTRRDTRISSALRLGDGLLTINGKTVPLR